MPCKKQHDSAGNAREESMTTLQGRCFRTETLNAAEHASPRLTRGLRHLRGRPTARRVRREAGSPAAVKEIVRGVARVAEPRGAGGSEPRGGTVAGTARLRGGAVARSGRSSGCRALGDPALPARRAACQRSSRPTGVQLSRIAGGKRRSSLSRRGPAPSGSALQPLREGTVWWC